jgi:hypothetical protein
LKKRVILAARQLVRKEDYKFNGVWENGIACFCRHTGLLSQNKSFKVKRFTIRPKACKYARSPVSPSKRRPTGLRKSYKSCFFHFGAF